MSRVDHIDHIDLCAIVCRFVRMASVKKRRGSQFWTVCYTLPNGLRKQVSSKLTDRNLALQLALKLERGAGAVRSGEFSRDFALRLVDEIAGLAGVQVVDPTSSRAFIERFLGVRVKGIAAATAVKYRAYCVEFLRFLGAVADAPLGAVTPALIASWRDAQLAKGLSAKSVVSAMAMIKMAFREAVDQQRISASPFDGIKRPRLSRGESPKTAFSWEQFQALLRATEGQWRLFILLGGLTGQRQQDVAQLDWSQVDFGRGVIVFRRAKTADSLTAAMHPTLSVELERWYAACGAPDRGFVLPEIAALPKTTSDAVSAVFRFKILPKIGIVQPYAEHENSRGRVPSKYSFHCLRHMLSTELNAAGVSAETRMLIVGHSDRRVSAGYTHAKMADAVAALQKLPKIN